MQAKTIISILQLVLQLANVSLCYVATVIVG